MGKLRTIFIDLCFIGLIYLTSQFHQIQWFTTFVVSFLCILVAVSSMVITYSKEAKEKWYKLMDEKKDGKIWRFYGFISDIILLMFLVYFNYKTASIAYFIYFLFQHVNRLNYYKDRKGEKI